MMRIISIFLVLLSVASAAAKEATLMAEDPVVEARMLKLASEMRCLVCQNESLAASHADFAVDLRREIRDLIKQGKTDDQIIAFMVERFGDFVMFRPPMKTTTVLLWFGPLILLLIGGSVLIFSLMRRRRRITEVPLSNVDLERAERLLGVSTDKDHKA